VSRLISILKRTRHLWGLLGTGVVLYVLVFVVLGKLDVSWIMPPTNKIAAAIIDLWPKMPFFVEKHPAPDGVGQEIYYTVPTRQLTPAELAKMGLTNVNPHPARPVNERPSSAQ
jgi:hypothetical protein